MHWRPQHELCHPCDINYDFIGRFENINHDAEYVLAKLSASERRSWNLSFPILNAFNSSASASQQERLSFYASVPRDIIETLVRKYQLDYQLFGYDYRWVYQN